MPSLRVLKMKKVTMRRHRKSYVYVVGPSDIYVGGVVRVNARKKKTKELSKGYNFKNGYP